MNKAIFITARLSSSRLPRKHLLRIENKCCIEYLIERVKKSKKTNIIVLCTTENEEDNELCDIAKKHNIYYFRGSEKDKLDRWYKSCLSYNVEFFVTADADDVLCEVELIDKAFVQYEKTKSDFIHWENCGIICGSFTYGISFSSLKKVCEIKNTDDTEMMWNYFLKTDLFKVQDLKKIPKIYKKPDIRLTLDYAEDFVVFHNIISYFSRKNKNFSLRDVVKYLNKHPEIKEINSFRHEDWKNNQQKNLKMVLK